MGEGGGGRGREGVPPEAVILTLSELTMYRKSHSHAHCVWVGGGGYICMGTCLSVCDACSFLSHSLSRCVCCLCMTWPALSLDLRLKALTKLAAGNGSGAIGTSSWKELCSVEEILKLIQ